MERPGENSIPNPFTFPYAGRELLTADKLLLQRPDLRNLYVYDVNLTTGTLLYSCAGGIGVTKEPYMVDMHRFIGTSTVLGALDSSLEADFGGKWSRRSYLAARERFNNDPWNRRMATLYMLWAGAGFKQRYRGRGYDAQYSPTTPDYGGLAEASRQSREKNLLFRREDLSSMSESIINDNVFLHLYLPTEFGTYGSGFVWNGSALERHVRVMNEFGALGYKVCVSALFERRGRIFRDYRASFPNFHHLVVPGFKVLEFSEMHFFNF